MMHNSTSANLDDLHFHHHHHHHNHHHKQIIMSEDQEQSSTIINSTCPISWKLYDNPFFSPTNTSISNNITSTNSPLKLKPKQLQRKYSASAKLVHHIHHSSSSPSPSSSSSDHHKMMNNTVSSSPCSSSTSTSNATGSDSSNNNVTHQLNQAKTQVAELKAELEMERKLRKKMETLNKKLSRELVDQVQKEKLCKCEDLTKEISRVKEEMQKMKQEMEEERKMLRMAEVLREERVQMKLADAHMFYQSNFVNQILLQHQLQKNPSSESSVCSEESKKMTVLSSSEQKSLSCSGSSISGKNVNLQRKVSPEPENPHIKQGIKGFVEFQRAIKAKNGCNYASNCSNYGGNSKQTRELGSYNKVECQKAQLRVLFKHKYPLPYSQHDHLIIS